MMLLQIYLLYNQVFLYLYSFCSTIAPLSADCWFCLGSKNVEKHLVTSVGEHVSLNSLLLVDTKDYIIYNQ